MISRGGWRVVGQCAAIMALCGFDAWATLRLLEAGCVEANPAMQVLLDWGVIPFLAGKFALTGVGCAVLAALRDRPLFRAGVRVGHVPPLLIGLYLILNAYQVVLLRGGA